MTPTASRTAPPRRATTRRSFLALALGLAGFGAVLLSPAGAGATPNLDETAKETLNKINAYFNSVRTMKGEFVQFAPDGSRTEGTFQLARPGRINFRYEKPARMEIIADGKSVAVRDRRLDTQDIWPLNKTPLRFLLADHIDLTSDAKVTRVSVEPDLVTVIIDEESTFGDGRLTLVFDGNNYELRQWTVTDAQGDTSVAIYNVATGVPVNDGAFEINYQRDYLNNRIKD
ncbi:outer membrane lipoprotein-sorting protein [Rhodobium orientis]|uniref:Outer membrane lipoprotein carrier protein LolA n=1 Tax=Rhodobium orientis TaxID=34017 RepID=A0A327JKS2_9HYPH|nr:outer-membrane lipoprotein carrier protein LolA [Rhodobium orientis]MBB4305209.1 outer membrane lipoprotein-sorting protein [Rhodobium orientis]MBK5948688.1 hypothetical protein [Rhodobium orientis]RAI26691.1 hypothetical protein CH339_13170 [Rhodobium orientis]